MKLFEPLQHTSRQTSQDIAAVEICPAYPEYMVVGTYTLVKEDDDKDHASQVRKGTLLVMPVTSIFKPSFLGQQQPHFDTKAFSFAILDIHFHPSDPTLLGVATSNAQIHFYRFIKHADVVSRQLQLKLIPLGFATIVPNDEGGLVPLITQFTWLPGTVISEKKERHDQQSVDLVATTSRHDVILVKVTLTAIRTLFDGLSAHASNLVAVATTNLPSHSLEAWTVAANVVKTSQEISALFVLSGGDDSAMIASLIEFGPDGKPEKASARSLHVLS
jgi:hypothetical protein